MHVAFQNDHSVYTECTARAREAAGLPRDGMSLGTRDTCIWALYICGPYLYMARIYIYIGALFVGALCIEVLYVVRAL